jgi:ABC-type enterobactin transport system permease subunit
MGTETSQVVNVETHNAERKDGIVTSAAGVAEETQLAGPEVTRRILRKIDLFLMPAMVLGKRVLQVEGGIFVLCLPINYRLRISVLR